MSLDKNVISNANILVLIEQTEKYLLSGDFEKAVGLLDSNGLSSTEYGKRLLLSALQRSGNWGRIITEITNVNSDDELSLKAIAFMGLRRWQDCEDLLETSSQNKSISNFLIKELSSKLHAERRVAL